MKRRQVSAWGIECIDGMMKSMDYQMYILNINMSPSALVLWAGQQVKGHIQKLTERGGGF